MEKMYRGITNSPKTELVALITETDTEIEVADSSVLLASEGVAVIGSGDVAETIKYTEVDGNILKGCIRGYEGIARSWIAGTRVARNFTAGDWNTAIDNIEGLYDRVDNDEVDPLTLQPGLQVVTAAKDARFKLGEIRGKTEINGQGRIGIIGVENPYAIGTTGNLVPPFYEWNLNGYHKPKVISPYILTINNPTADAHISTVDISVLSNSPYTFSINSYERGSLQIIELDEVGGISASHAVPFTNNERDTYQFNTQDTTQLLQLRIFSVDANIERTYENISLTVGTEPEPFQLQRKSMLALQTELHANPEDGNDPDVLFEQDGEYRKLAKWEKVVLDGSLKYMFVTSLEGFKVVYAPGIAANAAGQGDDDDVGNLFGTKYNGQKLVVDDSGVYAWPSADLIRISATNIYLSISNKDSGWDDDYIPSQEEIKAYFDGYKMYPYGDAAGAAAPYNGTGTKGWCYRIDGVTGNENSDFTGGTSSLPTTQAPNWSPYSLLYRLAKETVEPATVEGCLTLSEGDNMVEVGTGIVLRERANPQLDPYNQHQINTTTPGFESTKLKNKVDKFYAVYRDSRKDAEWYWNNTDAYGKVRALLLPGLFDQSAAYSVTYFKLEKSPSVPISGVVATNEKAQISDLMAGVAEALQRTSVLEQNKAEKDAPGWITPTLLNGWETYGGYPTLSVRKDLNKLSFDGLIRGGAYSPATIIANLPVGYRPTTNKVLDVPCMTESGVYGSAHLIMYSTGHISIFYAPGNEYLSFADVSIPL